MADEVFWKIEPFNICNYFKIMVSLVLELELEQEQELVQEQVQEQVQVQELVLKCISLNLIWQ